MANGAVGRKPKQAFKGIYRKRIGKLKDAILSMQKLDAKEVAKAATLNIPAITFQGLGSVSVATQLSTLLTRCNDALAARVGGGAVVPPPGGGGIS